MTERRHLDGQWSASDIASADLTAYLVQSQALSRAPAGKSTKISQKIALDSEFQR